MLLLSAKAVPNAMMAQKLQDGTHAIPENVQQWNFIRTCSMRKSSIVAQDVLRFVFTNEIERRRQLSMQQDSGGLTF